MKKLLVFIMIGCLILSMYGMVTAAGSSKNSIEANNVYSLIGSDKTTVLKKLGSNYKNAKMGYSNKDQGYYFKEFDAYLFFNKSNKLQYIQKNGKVTLFDKKIEGNFDSVYHSFGYKNTEKFYKGQDGQLHEIFAETAETFTLTYNYKDYVLEFVADSTSGKNLKVFIYKPNSFMDEKALAKLLTKSQKDITSNLGNQYVISPLKDEDFPEWIYFKSLGTYFCNYNDDDPKCAYIEFDENVSLGSLRSCMNYKQISSKLGPARIIESIEYAPDYRWYSVDYKKDGYQVSFMSEHSDMADSKLQLVQIAPDYKTRMYDNLYWKFTNEGARAILVYNNKEYPIDVPLVSQLLPIYDEKEYKAYGIPDEALGACIFSAYGDGDVSCFYVTVEGNKIKVFEGVDASNEDGNYKKVFKEAKSIDLKDYSKTSLEEQDCETVIMETPPMGYYISQYANTNKAVQPLKLEQSSKKANNIIDDDLWFKNNKLSINTYEVPNPYMDTKGNLPDYIDKTTWNDLIITKAIYDDKYVYCTYGKNFAEGYILNIYDKKTKKQTYSLDFSSYRYSKDFIDEDYDYIQQKIEWAEIRNNELYVSSSHMTYAKSSKNMNAYITAISLRNYEVLWRSEPLVSNAYNFLIINDVIVCGYGFTDESDYLYQLNIYTGKKLKQVLLKSAASYFVKKGNLLYVRTYNTDYVYKIAG